MPRFYLDVMILVDCLASPRSTLSKCTHGEHFRNSFTRTLYGVSPPCAGPNSLKYTDSEDLDKNFSRNSSQMSPRGDSQ